MTGALPERISREPAGRARLTLVPRPRVWPVRAALAAMFGTAVLYHWLNSRGHVTPTVFPDELLYSKLAQALAAGDGLTVRGEAVFFPSPLPVLAEVPAWLLGSGVTAFAALKALNAALMASAVFPAYALARRLVRPSFAIVAAAATVATPAMLYHAYLMSEALAYPVFLLACATIVRAVERPSTRMELAVVGVSLVACLTRLQFVVLPVAYLLVATLAPWLSGEGVRVALRRHRHSLSLVTGMLALPLLTGGFVLGTYKGVAVLDYAPLDVAGWSAFTAVLLAFGAGWLVIPGALLGLVARPRRRTEAAFGVLAAVLVVGLLVEAGMIAAGEADRAMERYAIYLVPLLFVSFFAYVERGAPHRRVYVALALVLGCTAWLVPFPARAGTLFAFDAPTFSAYAQLAAWWGHPNAATVFALVPLAGGIALALLRLSGGRVALGIGVAAVSLMLLSGIPAYAGDRAVARGTLELRAGSPPDWLDRSNLGSADYLQLAGGSAHYGWVLEAWNRDFGRAIQLGVPSYDGFASSSARIDRDGRLLVDGEPLRAGVLVVNDFASRLEVRGARVVARPRPGLAALRLPAAPLARSLATGLTFDGWAGALVRYQAWPQGRDPGVYRLTLELPRGFDEREVTLSAGAAKRTLTLGPGQRRTIELPACGGTLPPLQIAVDHADFVGAGTANARLVAVRIPSISYTRARLKEEAQGALAACR
jgi:Dolichyl-phosphate-mannose-protein mannosyltransferase